MKSFQEMQIQKELLMSEQEKIEVIGGRQVGNGTDYFGPSNPSSISTYVDGFYWGSDGTSGNLFGDSYNIARKVHFTVGGPVAKMTVKKS